ncbi:phytoene desaturase family protein [Agromyces seonyuensis]|uniref:Phytoene desaturase n=1 Tax=Agromyces seonyuensis TaxID=2662446 RepID=A0A6I4NUV5_9MICO|nr:phytoene desaturase family protein [Agromyces seonyuensis]MWB98236.1 phytoene desaturase [Agromyces seonyuensis]
MIEPATQRAVVIGGGISGLASAALLAREGYEVTVLEQNDTVGGRAGSWAADGFRFDTGPSWYLMPEVFDHFFRLLGSSADEELDLRTLEPGYRVYSEGQAPVDLHAERERNEAVFEEIEPGAGAALSDYLDSAAETERLARAHFLSSTHESLRPLVDPAVLRRLPRLLRLLFQPLDSFIGSRFRDLRLRQILGYPAVFLGTSPYRAPSMYHLMSALDLDQGVRYPMGGFAEVIAAVERHATREGAKIRTGARAVAIEMADARADARRGVRARVSGVRWADVFGVEHVEPADVVVAACDLNLVAERLLPPELAERRPAARARRVSGPGAVLVLLGVKGGAPELAHHTLLFARDWEAGFRRIFDAPTAVPDPASLYICKPSATDPSVAPEGHENLFVLVPVPADPSIGAGGRDGDGDPAVEAVADRAIAQIAEWAGIPDLAERVVLRRTIGPADFERDFGSTDGSALGPAHTLAQSAFFRGRTASRRVDGLLFAGGDAVPGIGLPMCLISAELVVKSLRGDTSAEPLTAPLPVPAFSPEAAAVREQEPAGVRGDGVAR